MAAAALACAKPTTIRTQFVQSRAFLGTWIGEKDSKDFDVTMDMDADSVDSAMVRSYVFACHLFFSSWDEQRAHIARLFAPITICLDSSATDEMRDEFADWLYDQDNLSNAETLYDGTCMSYKKEIY